MSAASSQQRGGRRQPFGFLNANTVPTATKSFSAVGLGGGATKRGESSKPKKFRGVLKSIIISRKKSERSAEAEEDAAMQEAPTKKTKVDALEEDSKPCAISGPAAATAATETDIANVQEPKADI